MTDTLATLPAKIGTPILAAWNAKGDLLDVLATPAPQPTREIGLLHRFYTRCAASELPQLHPLADTIETRWP